MNPPEIGVTADLVRAAVSEISLVRPGMDPAELGRVAGLARRAASELAGDGDREPPFWRRVGEISERVLDQLGADTGGGDGSGLAAPTDDGNRLLGDGAGADDADIRVTAGADGGPDGNVDIDAGAGQDGPDADVAGAQHGPDIGGGPSLPGGADNPIPGGDTGAPPGEWTTSSLARLAGDFARDPDGARESLDPLDCQQHIGVIEGLSHLLGTAQAAQHPYARPANQADGATPTTKGETP
jgi:hypothetical protein